MDELAARLAAQAESRGAAIEPPALDPEVSRQVLELARVAAHTQERRFAPLASYLAGVAAERLRTLGGAAAGGAVADMIREVREELEAESPPGEERPPA